MTRTEQKNQGWTELEKDFQRRTRESKGKSQEEQDDLINDMIEARAEFMISDAAFTTLLTIFLFRGTITEADYKEIKKGIQA